MNSYINETLQKWHSKIKDLEIIKPIKSGKEASVYLVYSSSIEKDRNLFALKIYRENHLKASNAEYLLGKHFKERSHQKAVAKRNKFGKELIQRVWTRREYYMLEKLYSQRTKVPKVYDFTDNSILMEYIGDENIAAPKLISVDLDHLTAKRFYNEVINSMRIFLDNGIVHGDLSEHNILYWDNEIYIIDFP